MNLLKRLVVLTTLTTFALTGSVTPIVFIPQVPSDFQLSQNHSSTHQMAAINEWGPERAKSELRFQELLNESSTNVSASNIKLTTKPDSRAELRGVDNLEKLLEDLKSGDFKLRIRALKSMKKIRRNRLQVAIPAVIEVLGDNALRVQRRAEEVLVYIGEAAIPALVRRAKKDDWIKRRNIVEVLGHIPSPDAIPFLLESLEDEESTVQIEATSALADMSQSKHLDTLLLEELGLAIPILADQLNKSNYSSAAYSSTAILEIGRKNPKALTIAMPDILPKLIEALKTQEARADILRNIIAILQLMGPRAKDAVKSLKPLLNHANKDVQIEALVAIHSITGGNVPKDLGQISVKPQAQRPNILKWLLSRVGGVLQRLNSLVPRIRAESPAGIKAPSQQIGIPESLGMEMRHGRFVLDDQVAVVISGVLKRGDEVARAIFRTQESSSPMRPPDEMEKALNQIMNGWLEPLDSDLLRPFHLNERPHESKMGILSLMIDALLNARGIILSDVDLSKYLEHILQPNNIVYSKSVIQRATPKQLESSLEHEEFHRALSVNAQISQQLERVYRHLLEFARETPVGGQWQKAISEVGIQANNLVEVLENVVKEEYPIFASDEFWTQLLKTETEEPVAIVIKQIFNYLRQLARTQNIQLYRELSAAIDSLGRLRESAAVEAKLDMAALKASRSELRVITDREDVEALADHFGLFDANDFAYTFTLDGIPSFANKALSAQELIDLFKSFQTVRNLAKETRFPLIGEGNALTRERLLHWSNLLRNKLFTEKEIKTQFLELSKHLQKESPPLESSAVLLKTPVRDLGFSIRITRALVHSAIETLGVLIRIKSDESLRKMLIFNSRSFSKDSLGNIDAFIEVLDSQISISEETPVDTLALDGYQKRFLIDLGIHTVGEFEKFMKEGENLSERVFAKQIQHRIEVIRKFDNQPRAKVEKAGDRVEGQGSETDMRDTHSRAELRVSIRKSLEEYIKRAKFSEGDYKITGFADELDNFPAEIEVTLFRDRNRTREVAGDLVELEKLTEYVAKSFTNYTRPYGYGAKFSKASISATGGNERLQVIIRFVREFLPIDSRQFTGAVVGDDWKQIGSLEARRSSSDDNSVELRVRKNDQIIDQQTLHVEEKGNPVILASGQFDDAPIAHVMRDGFEIRVIDAPLLKNEMWKGFYMNGDLQIRTEPVFHRLATQLEVTNAFQRHVGSFLKRGGDYRRFQLESFGEANQIPSAEAILSRWIWDIKHPYDLIEVSRDQILRAIDEFNGEFFSPYSMMPETSGHITYIYLKKRPVHLTKFNSSALDVNILRELDLDKETFDHAVINKFFILAANESQDIIEEFNIGKKKFKIDIHFTGRETADIRLYQNEAAVYQATATFKRAELREASKEEQIDDFSLDSSSLIFPKTRRELRKTVEQMNELISRYPITGMVEGITRLIGFDLNVSQAAATQNLSELRAVAFCPEVTMQLADIVAQVTQELARSEMRVVIFARTKEEIGALRGLFSVEFQSKIDSGDILITSRTNDEAQILRGAKRAELRAVGLPEDQAFAKLLQKRLPHVNVIPQIAYKDQILSFFGQFTETLRSELRAKFIQSIAA